MSEKHVDWHIKYRPSTLEDVIGQDSVVSNIKHKLETGFPHVILFIGPSGVGKTTLARIIADRIGCENQYVKEVDAATNSGVAEVRALTSDLAYTTFTGGKKMVIIDECQSLSTKAWEALLKVTEEPPPHVFFVFCTTEAHKVPKTIKTRSTEYILRDIDDENLEILLSTVAEQEGMTLDDAALDLIDLSVKEAFGSARQSIVNFSKVVNCQNLKEAESLFGYAEKSKEIIDFCRHLAYKCSGLDSYEASLEQWNKAVKILRDTDKSAESIRLTIVNYTAKVLTGNTKDPIHFLNILDAFSEECKTSEKMAPILRATGQVIFTE
jgi:DNA polymerase III gamma/tau subunit